jgi:hypothetical protein
MKKISTLLLFVSLSAFAEQSSLVPSCPREEMLKGYGSVFGDKSAMEWFQSKNGDSKEQPTKPANGLTKDKLWQATIDTIGHMPIAVSDKEGGVIATDWYKDTKHKGERYKLNVVIKDPASISVKEFRQRLKGESWQDIDEHTDHMLQLIAKIVKRAKALK